MKNTPIPDKDMLDLDLDLDLDTSFICTYKLLEKDNLALECYQMQLMQVFKLANYNDAIIQKKILCIYNFLRENMEFQNILSILSPKIFNFEILDNEMPKNRPSDKYNLYTTFQALFSYTYFDVFHKCLSRYIRDAERDKNKSELCYFDELKKLILVS